MGKRVVTNSSQLNTYKLVYNTDSEKFTITYSYDNNDMKLLKTDELLDSTLGHENPVTFYVVYLVTLQYDNTNKITFVSLRSDKLNNSVKAVIKITNVFKNSINSSDLQKVDGLTLNYEEFSAIMATNTPMMTTTNVGNPAKRTFAQLSPNSEGGASICTLYGKKYVKYVKYKGVFITIKQFHKKFGSQVNLPKREYLKVRGEYMTINKAEKVLVTDTKRKIK